MRLCAQGQSDRVAGAVSRGPAATVTRCKGSGGPPRRAAENAENTHRKTIPGTRRKFGRANTEGDMKISRVYCVAAVTVGVISMALGTSSPNLAARRATAPAPAAAVMSSFDTCLVDAAGNQLIWNSTTGAYRSTRASDGFLLTGTGVVGLVNGIRTLTDFKTDRRLSAGFNTGQLTGSATIYLMVAQGVWQVVRIIDNNPSATCTLPPVITSFSSDVSFCPDDVQCHIGHPGVHVCTNQRLVPFSS